MNSAQLLHNPERQGEKILIKNVVMSMPTMIECTQVDIDEILLKQEERKFLKKKKRRQNKKRKKEKKIHQARTSFTIEESATLYLSQIIQKIYAGKAFFEEQVTNIEFCLLHMMGANKFHDFLNQIVKCQVCNIQKSIQQYMQLLLQAPQDDEDQEKFYLLMVDKIYQEYLDLKNASLQVQKIINLFVRMVSGTQDKFQQKHQLDRSTFKFLVETDETIKSLIKMCEQKISICNYKQVMRLKEIGQILKNNTQQLLIDQEEFYIEESTEVDEEEMMENNRTPPLPAEVEEIVDDLHSLAINENQRTKCNVGREWLQSLKRRVMEE